MTNNTFTQRKFLLTSEMSLSNAGVYQKRLAPIPVLQLTGTQRQRPPRCRTIDGQSADVLPSLVLPEKFLKAVDSCRLPSRGGVDLANLVISNTHRKLTTAQSTTIGPLNVRNALIGRLAPVQRAPHVEQQGDMIDFPLPQSSVSLFRRNSSPLAPFCSDSAAPSPIGVRAQYRSSSMVEPTKVDALLLSEASLTCPPSLQCNNIIEEPQHRGICSDSPTRAQCRNTSGTLNTPTLIFDASPANMRCNEIMSDIDEVLQWSDRAAARALTLSK